MPEFFQIQDFDQPISHHPVDDIEPDQTELSGLSEALARIVIWQISGTSMESIAARTLIISECLELNDKTLSWSDIGDQVGMSRAAIQFMAKDLESQFGLRSLNTRENETREKCKQAQIRLNKGKG